MSESLFTSWDNALLFRKLATLRLDVPVFASVEELRWKGPRSNFEEYAQRLKLSGLVDRIAAAKAAGSLSR